MSEHNELSPEAIELAALKKSIRDQRIDAALATLSAKGMTEPALKKFAAILKAEDADAIMLSEGAEPVDAADALAALADDLEFVPVETPDDDDEQTPPAAEAELSADEAHMARLLGVSVEDYNKAKNMKED